MDFKTPCYNYKTSISDWDYEEDIRDATSLYCTNYLLTKEESNSNENPCILLILQNRYISFHVYELVTHL